MSNGQPYSLLVGAGQLYIAPANTAEPTLSPSAPGGVWRSLGETDGGVKVTKTRSREKFSSDQRTGTVKSVQTEEGVTIETNLQESTLENLADVIGLSVIDTPPASGVIGTRKVGMYSGFSIKEFALLFRGTSPYGDYPAQYWIPRGYLDDDVEMEFTKEDKTLIPVKFEVLEDLNTSNENQRFGNVTYQDAAAL